MFFILLLILDYFLFNNLGTGGYDSQLDKVNLTNNSRSPKAEYKNNNVSYIENNTGNKYAQFDLIDDN